MKQGMLHEQERMLHSPILPWPEKTCIPIQSPVPIHSRVQSLLLPESGA